MLQIARTIQDAAVNYDLDLVGDTGGTQNSNSLVSAVMTHAGLDMDSYVPLIAGDDNVGVANTIDQIAYVIDMSGIPGYSGADVLVGGSIGDRLTGGSGADRLTGGAGDDTLIATEEGLDQALIETTPEGVTILHDGYLLSDDRDSDILDGGAGDDTYHAGIEIELANAEGINGNGQYQAVPIDFIAYRLDVPGGEIAMPGPINADVFEHVDFVIDEDGVGSIHAGIDGFEFFGWGGKIMHGRWIPTLHSNGILRMRSCSKGHPELICSTSIRSPIFP